MESGCPVYPRSEIMAPKLVVWLGDSLRAVRGFEPEGRRRAGQELGGRLDIELARQRYRNLIRDRTQ
jgi:hypothetical protein